MSTTQKPLTAIERVERSFDAGKQNLIELAGKTAPLDFDRVKRIVIAALRRDPNLAACAPESIVQSVQDAVRLGLEPNGPQGHCYLVPYKDKCQLILGYKGLIALARRSGEILSIEAHLIYEHDQYDVAFGSDPRIVHKPNLRTDRGAPIAAYAIAKLAGGGVQSDVMRIDEIDKIMKSSPSRGDRGPWLEHRDEMRRKTAIRRLCKTLPMSVALADALDAEEQREIDVSPPPKSSRQSTSLPPAALVTDGTDDAAAELAAVGGPVEETPAPVAVETKPVAVHDHGEEIALIAERIDMMDDSSAYKIIADDLRAAHARKANPLPKEHYEALSKKLLAAKDDLKRAGK